MPRGKAKPKQEVSKLLQAMQFLSVCQKNEANNDAQMYCNLQNKTATAFDGILAAGIAIDEELNACPHTHQMLLALSRCGEKFQIVQLSQETLKIVSNGFEAYIPCCQRERLTAVNPEAGNIAVAPGLTPAIEIAAPLASDKADVLEAASIQITANSVISTNREMVIEAWHGSMLPFDEFLIPKMAAVALSKIKKKVISVGIKPISSTIQTQNVAAYATSWLPEYEAITFWFEDGSWLRTQLYKGKWRDNVKSLLKLPSDTARPVPYSFFETVAKVLPFSEDGKVYCAESKVASHYVDQKGAGYSLHVDDGPSMKIYKGSNLIQAGKVLKSGIIMDESYKNFTMFFGGNVRCAVWHDPLILNDEDIPF